MTASNLRFWIPINEFDASIPDQRLLQFIPTLLGIYMLTFVLIRVLPGDPAQFLEGDRDDEQSLAATRARLGIDEPLTTQFMIFFGDALHGDLGRSYITTAPSRT